MEQIFGALPSPEDARDWRVGAAMDDIAQQYPENYRVWSPEVKRQFGGSCVANALASIFEAQTRRERGETPLFSIGGIYGNRREEDPPYGPGMVVRTACKTVVKWGDVPKEIFENLHEMEWVRTDFEQQYPNFADKMQKPLACYVRIGSLQEYKAFLTRYQIPALVSVQAERITGGAYSGGHCVIGIGWENDKLLLQNSWGIDNYTYPKIAFEETNEVWGVYGMGKQNFADVEPDRWSAKAIEACAEKGLLLGFPDGLFHPEEPLTREQFAVVLERMMQK